MSGYGIKDEIASKNHSHKKSDIIDFPERIRADGGNADTVANRKPGSDAGNLVVLNGTGKIDADLIPITESKKLTIIQSDGTTNTYNGTIDTTINIKKVTTNIFNERGELVFPNGNRLWIA